MPACYIERDSHTVEFGVVPVERQLRLEKENIFPNEWAVSCASKESKTGQTTRRHNEKIGVGANNLPMEPHTSNTLPSNTSHQTIHPIDMLLSLPDHDRMSFL